MRDVWHLGAHTSISTPPTIPPLSSLWGSPSSFSSLTSYITQTSTIILSSSLPPPFLFLSFPLPPSLRTDLLAERGDNRGPRWHVHAGCQRLGREHHLWDGGKRKKRESIAQRKRRRKGMGDEGTEGKSKLGFRLQKYEPWRQPPSPPLSPSLPLPLPLSPESDFH